MRVGEYEQVVRKIHPHKEIPEKVNITIICAAH